MARVFSARPGSAARTLAATAISLHLTLGECSADAAQPTKQLFSTLSRATTNWLWDSQSDRRLADSDRRSLAAGAVVNWVSGPFGDCSDFCDTPVKSSSLECMSPDDGRVLADSSCHHRTRPPTFKNCSCELGPCHSTPKNCSAFAAELAAPVIFPDTMELEYEVIGCYQRASKDVNATECLAGDAAMRDYGCMAWSGTPPCRSGLPFFRNCEATTLASCSAFCMCKGFDIMAIVEEKECRCGASPLNTQVWHDRTPPETLLFSTSELEAASPGTCPVWVARYPGRYYAGGLPPEVDKCGNVEDGAYLHSILTGHKRSPMEEEHSKPAGHSATPSHFGHDEPVAPPPALEEQADDPVSPMWVRNCWPGNCGPGKGQWTTRVSTAPTGVADNFQEYVLVQYTWNDGVANEAVQVVDDTRKDTFRQAVEAWHTDTCIVLEETDTPTGNNYIEVGVYDPAGCYVLGTGQGFSKINLGWCSGAIHLGNMIHEIGHALGMNHEMQRADGIVAYHGYGPYLLIHWDAIALQGADPLQYQARQESYVGSAYDGPGDPHQGHAAYDFGSIMHYPAGDRFDTFPESGKDLTGQRDALSDGDILQIFDQYQCRNKSDGSPSFVVSPAPTTLRVSGVCNSALNGDYSLVGNTASGAPYYKLDTSIWYHLYWDPECGTGHSEYWLFDSSAPSTTLEKDLDGSDGVCSMLGLTKNTYTGHPPLGQSYWQVWCNPDWEWIWVTIVATDTTSTTVSTSTTETATTTTDTTATATTVTATPTTTTTATATTVTTITVTDTTVTTTTVTDTTATATTETVTTLPYTITETTTTVTDTTATTATATTTTATATTVTTATVTTTSTDTTTTDTTTGTTTTSTVTVTTTTTATTTETNTTTTVSRTTFTSTITNTTTTTATATTATFTTTMTSTTATTTSTATNTTATASTTSSSVTSTATNTTTFTTSTRSVTSVTSVTVTVAGGEPPASPTVLTRQAEAAESAVVSQLLGGSKNSSATQVGDFTVAGVRVDSNSGEAAVLAVEGTEVEVSLPSSVLLSSLGEDFFVVVTLLGADSVASMSSGDDEVQTSVSVNLYSLNGDSVEVEDGLQEPIQITLSTGGSAVEGVVCAYWDEADSAWLTDGVVLDEEAAEKGSIVCNVYHLTLFAAIVRSYECSQLKLLSEEGVSALREGGWQSSGAAWFFWALLMAFALLLAIGALLDCRRRRDQRWSDEDFLIAFEGERADGEGAAKRGCIAGLCAFLATCICNCVLMDVFAEVCSSWCGYIGDLKDLCGGFLGGVQLLCGGRGGALVYDIMSYTVDSSAWRQAAASAGISRDSSKFLRRSEETKQMMLASHTNSAARNGNNVAATADVVPEAKRLSSSSSGASLSLDNLGKLHKAVSIHLGRHLLSVAQCGSLPGSVCRLFLCQNPVGSCLLRSVFFASTQRVVLFMVNVIGALMLCTVFFETTGTLSRRVRKSGCKPPEDSAGQIGRLFAVGLGAFVISVLPSIVLRSLCTRSIKTFDYKGCPGWGRQLRTWCGQDALIWVLAFVYLGFSTFFILLFLANVSQQDQDAWIKSGAVSIVLNIVIVPFLISLIVPLAAMVSLSLASAVNKVEKRKLINERHVMAQREHENLNSPRVHV